MGRPLPVVAFDLDGTLVDSASDLARALNGALAELELRTFSVEVARGFVGNGARRLVERALAHQGCTLERTDEVLAAFRRHYERDLVGDTRPYPGIPAVLEALAPHALLAVATNKPGAFARPLVDALLPGRFAVVLGPDDVGSLKPDPGVVRAIEARLSSTVAVFVGDSAIDKQTARNAGVRFVGVSWGFFDRAELDGADRIVDDTAALGAAVLGELGARATQFGA